MRKDGEDMELALDTPARLRAVPRAEVDTTENASDADLLVRVADRDRDAFELLYRRYVRSVFGLALRRLRDRQRGAAAPWLYAVARNAIIDRLRARSEPPSDVPETPSGEPGPSDRAESSFVAWRVHRALEELPEKEREVVELAYWSEMSQSEVAAYLHIPLGTVKTRTRSALTHLAGLLEGELA
jgi:RNA polymerase sigma-70 factor (ECF subfamily)